jgi:long-chain acyl-CoA synthetase
MPLRPRTRLHADPAGVFVHTAILDSCRRFANNTAIVDYSVDADAPRRFTYAEYGDTVERLARGLVAAGVQPGEIVAIYLFNCWEFAAAYHATTLAGAIPTPLNPSYREREVRYQLENSTAAILITDGSLIRGMDLSRLPHLRRIFTTRQDAPGAQPFSTLLASNSAPLPSPNSAADETLAALPYSSGTTGLPKGVMLSHSNLVTNAYQFLAPGEAGTFRSNDVALCVLPLYHIYGLNVVLNPVLIVGATLVLLPRFDLQSVLDLMLRERVTFMPLVPPLVNAFCQAAQQDQFPHDHRLRYVKCGAAPLAPDLARRFDQLTGVPVVQGYGMTEASPVTHRGFLEAELYRPESIGPALAQTQCLLLDESGNHVATGEPGELVMRGPQFMLGYWNAPDATAAVLRDGWYWSGDVARVDEAGFFQIVDRRKEMIKYKGFPIAPAEVEAVLLEHPAVRDCGVVGRADIAAGETPCAFVVLRDDYSGDKSESELIGYVAERLTGYKQPREMHFVNSIPRNPSGKILRRELRNLL